MVEELSFLKNQEEELIQGSLLLNSSIGLVTDHV